MRPSNLALKASKRFAPAKGGVKKPHWYYLSHVYPPTIIENRCKLFNAVPWSGNFFKFELHHCSKLCYQKFIESHLGNHQILNSKELHNKSLNTCIIFKCRIYDGLIASSNFKKVTGCQQKLQTHILTFSHFHICGIPVSKWQQKLHFHILSRKNCIYGLRLKQTGEVQEKRVRHNKTYTKNKY
jgi:hypothetical protein